MHLSANKGTSGEVNLIWEHYEGIQINYYYIFRGTDSTEMRVIDSISYDISKTQYTDLNPPAGVVYYQIGVKLDEVIILSTGKKADSGPYSHSMSNIEDNRFQTGLNNLKSAGELTIYPNPFNETAILKFPDQESGLFRLRVMDITGKVLREINHISGSEYILERNDLQQGYYIIELSGDKIYRGRIVVE
jgi:hypothetical protein